MLLMSFLATVATINEDTTKDSSIGNPIPVVSGARGNGENAEGSKGYPNAPPSVTSASISASVSQPVPLLGKFSFQVLAVPHFCIHSRRITPTKQNIIRAAGMLNL